MPPTKRNNGPRQSQEQRQVQSLESVKVAIHASIAYIMQERTDLPKEAFRTVRLRTDSPTTRYDKFLSGTTKSPQFGNVEVSILERKSLTRVDRFLNILERGVFFALENGWLSSLHFNMCLRGQNLSNVVESWTFAFEYEDNSRQVTGVGITSPSKQKKKIPMSSVSEQVTCLIEGMGELLTSIPKLTKKMDYYLIAFYNEHCPKGYSTTAPGFDDKRPPSALRFPDSSKYGQKHGKVGPARFDQHRLGITANLLDSKGASLIDNLEFDTADFNAVIDKDNEKGLALQAEPSVHTEQGHLSLAAIETPNDEQTQLEELPSTLVRQDTHASHQLRAIELKDMSLPSSGVGQTLYSSANGTFPQESAHVPRLKGEILESLLESERNQNKYYNNGPLSAPLELVRSVNSGRFAAPMNLVYSHKGDPQNLDPTDVLCVCNDEQSDGEDLIRCNICLTWQHLDCIGYQDELDARIPDIYVCFTCLFDPGLRLQPGRPGKQPKPNVTNGIRKQAVINRIIRRIQRTGYPEGVFSQVASAFGCRVKEFIVVKTSLAEDQIILANPIQCANRYRLNTSEEASKKVDEILSKSLARVGPFYEQPSENAVLGSQDVADDGEYQHRRDSPTIHRASSPNSKRGAGQMEGVEISRSKRPRSLRASPPEQAEAQMQLPTSFQPLRATYMASQSQRQAGPDSGDVHSSIEKYYRQDMSGGYESDSSYHSKSSSSSFPGNMVKLSLDRSTASVAAADSEL